MEKILPANIFWVKRVSLTKNHFYIDLINFFVVMVHFRPMFYDIYHNYQKLGYE
jgi:hypothetical protein